MEEKVLREWKLQKKERKKGHKSQIEHLRFRVRTLIYYLFTSPTVSFKFCVTLLLFFL